MSSFADCANIYKAQKLLMFVYFKQPSDRSLAHFYWVKTMQRSLYLISKPVLVKFT